MASGFEVIAGEPYSAQFAAGENGSIGVSDAIAVIEPPVNIGDEENIALGCIFDQFPGVKVKVEHMATTITKTMIAIEVLDRDRSQLKLEKTSHEARIQTAREAMHEYIGFLNRVEAGTFDGFTFNVIEH